MNIIKKNLKTFIIGGASLLLLGLAPNVQCTNAISIEGTTGTGTEADPIKVDTFDELKAAMQSDEKVLYIDVDSFTNTTALDYYVLTCSKDYEQGMCAIDIPSNATRYLNVDCTIDCRANSVGKLNSFINVEMGSKLYLSGTGTINVTFNATLGENAVIYGKMGSFIEIDGVTISTLGGTISTFHRAIYGYSSTININSGHFIGYRDPTCDVGEEVSGVYVEKSSVLNIKTGIFSGPGYGLTILDSAVRAEISGGIFYDGIRVPKDKEISDYLADGKRYVYDASNKYYSVLNENYEITLEGKGNPKSYYLGKQITSQQAGLAVALAADSVDSNGYAFKEWVSDDVTINNPQSYSSAYFTMPEKDVTVKATYKEPYKINVMGGNAKAYYSGYQVTSQLAGNAVALITSDTYEGRNFVRWVSDDVTITNPESHSSAYFVMPEKDVTIVALYEGDLPYLTGVTLIDGVLSWDEFAGASEYDWSLANGGGYCEENYLDLNKLCKSFGKETGTYNFSVKAVDENRNPISAKYTGTFDYVSNSTKLATPTNLRWERNKLSWDPVPNADYYCVIIYDFGYPHEVYEPCYYATGLFVDDEVYYSISASSYNTDYLDSDWARSPDISPEAEFVLSEDNVYIDDKGILYFTEEIPDAYEYCLSVASIGAYEDSAPINLMAIMSNAECDSGEYDINITVRDEDGYPLTNTYTYHDWYYDATKGPQQLTGTVTVTGEWKCGETVTATVTDTNNTGNLSYVWFFTNDAEDVFYGTGVFTPSITITSQYVGYKLFVVVSSDYETLDIRSEPSPKIIKADAPAAPTSMVATDCTNDNQNDGMISNVDFSMEYLSPDGTWHNVSFDPICDLQPGTYYFRYMETDERYASESTPVVVNAYEDLNKYSISVTGGYAEIDSATVTESQKGLIVSIKATDIPKGYEFDSWISEQAVFNNPQSSETTFTMPNQNVSIYATYKPAALTGTATISGNLAYGETLTANLEGSNNTGKIAYQWYRGSTPIQGAIYQTYTLSEDDVNRAIKVEVSSTIQTGSIFSSVTTAIAKASTSVPTGISSTACTTASNNDGTITGVDSTMEYKLDDGDWNSIEGNTITGLTDGTYYVRYKETATNLASNPTTVVVGAYVPPVQYGITVDNGVASSSTSEAGEVITISASQAPTGKVFDKWVSDDVTFENANSAETTFIMPEKDVSISATYKAAALTGSVTIYGSFSYGATLTANLVGGNNTGTLSYQWYRGDSPIPGATNNTYVLTVDDINNNIKVEVSSDVQTGSTFSYATDTIAKASTSVPTGISSTTCTTASNNDGKITGVDSTMEYRSYSGSWTSITGTTITGLTNGTYYVRYKETATNVASNSVTVVVGAYEAPAQYGITVDNGTANCETSEAGKTITITASEAPTGKVFDKWVSDDVTFEDAYSAETTFVMPDKNVSISATYKAAPLFGGVSISGNPTYGETLTANLVGSNNTGNLSYQWYRGDSPIPGATNQTYTLSLDDINETIKVKISSDVQIGSIFSFATAPIAKASTSVPTGISSTACTTASNNDGTITGVDSTMEYKLGDGDWNGIEGNTITGLTNGTYYVRYKETATNLASNPVTIVVGAYVAPTQYGITVDNGTASSATSEAGKVITITASEAPAGKVFDKWVSDDVTFANANSVETTFTMPSKNVIISATYKNIQYVISFDANGGSGSMSNVSKEYNNTYVLPANTMTAPEGKEFKCWSVNGVEKNVGDTIVIKNDVTIKAVWKDVEVVKYNVVFDSNGGTGSMAKVETSGEYVLPANTMTAPEGKEFKCWSVDGVEMNVGSKINVTKNTTIKAVWKNIDNSIDSPVDDPVEIPQEETGLSGGAIAGIVIGSVVAVAAAAYFVLGFTLYKKGKLSGKFFDTIFKWIKK